MTPLHLPSPNKHYSPPKPGKVGEKKKILAAAKTGGGREGGEAMSSSYANDVDVDWDQGSRWSTQAAIRAQDRKFRCAVIAAHPEFAPPAPVPVARLAPSRGQRPRDILALGAPIIPDASPAWRRIIWEVAAKHGISFPEVLSQRRDRAIVRARYEAMYRMKKETTMSFPAIGRRFNRDHTTVLYGVEQHEKRLAANAEYQPVARP